VRWFFDPFLRSPRSRFRIKKFWGFDRKFAVFSTYSKFHSAQTPNKLKELRMRKNNFPLSTRSVEFKGTVSQKNGMGYFTLARRTKTNLNFWSSEKKYHSAH
jgi:hypothetical protein